MIPDDSGLTLEAVKRQFSETEAELRHVLESSKSIQGASDQLSGARTQLEQTGSQIHRVLEGWIELSGRIQVAASAIEETVPAELRRTIDNLSVEIGAGMVKIDQVVLGQTTLMERLTSLEGATHRLRILVIVAIALVIAGIVSVFVVGGP